MTRGAADPDAFVILLPVFNGATYLPAQLQSIAAQTDKNWILILSDDGSTDGSADIIRDFGYQIGDRVILRQGPRVGLTAHIIDLMRAVPDGTGPIVMCDQDDIWFKDRLASDRHDLNAVPDARARATLLCRRTHLCDADGMPIGLSPPRPRTPSFANALVQNIASGNTMVLNRALFDIVKRTLDAARGCAYHDWWLYQIVTATGGQVRHLDTPKIYYRQHGTNLVGVPRGVTGFFKRAARLWSGRGGAEAGTHIAALTTIEDMFSPAARARLASFRAARSGTVIARLRNLVHCGVYRQSRRETALLYIAALRGRL